MSVHSRAGARRQPWQARPHRARSLASILALLTPVALAPAAIAPARAATVDAVEELKQLSLEDLAGIEITSVSKRPEPLSEAAASVYVITAEDIRRSGATGLPEALRLAPNLLVTRQDADTWSVSARGFNGVANSNKMLVLIDGRVAYSPLFAGVFWDETHVVLEDIERIEVISGPGGTIWGANAVNGVINVITREASQTQGGLASAYYGNVDQGATLRYGGDLGENGAYRVYATGFEHGHSVDPDGTSAMDDWIGRQAGFRWDWAGVEHDLTFQGDLYRNTLEGGTQLSGHNLLARWGRPVTEASRLEVHAYYDLAHRETPTFTDTLETYDIEGRNVLSIGDRHEIVWGGGYRMVRDEFGGATLAFLPQRETLHYGNVFIQDSIRLAPDLVFVAGTKLEYNSYTDLELLPTARLSWQAWEGGLLWGAVSRTVRTPSRLDRDFFVPGLVAGGPDFKSEELIVYELGYRGQALEDTSVSVTLFYHDYDDLRTLELSPTGGAPVIANGLEGHSWGVEAWGEYAATDWWLLSAGGTLLHESFRLKDGVTDLSGASSLGNDPDFTYRLSSRMNVAEDVELDLTLRGVDDLPAPAVPDYVELDARLGWLVTDDLELSVAGFNLLDNQHPEGGALATRQEVRRSVLVGARWTF